MREFYLHGFGSDAATFRAACEPLTESSQRIFLQGPEADRFSGRRRWFAFSARSERLHAGIQAAAMVAEQEIRHWLAWLQQAEDAPLALTGHSQGAMLCLELLRQRRLNVREVRCYAGYLPATLLDGDASGHDQPAQLHMYSSAGDRFIPPAGVLATLDYFSRQAGVTVFHHEAASLSHDFSPAWLEPGNFNCKKTRHETFA
jgi:predicted esterase